MRAAGGRRGLLLVGQSEERGGINPLAEIIRRQDVQAPAGITVGFYCDLLNRIASGVEGGKIARFGVGVWKDIRVDEEWDFEHAVMSDKADTPRRGIITAAPIGKAQAHRQTTSKQKRTRRLHGSRRPQSLPTSPSQSEQHRIDDESDRRDHTELQKQPVIVEKIDRSGKRNFHGGLLSGFADQLYFIMKAVLALFNLNYFLRRNIILSNF
jgi:hypothetical protein